MLWVTAVTRHWSALCPGSRELASRHWHTWANIAREKGWLSSVAPVFLCASTTSFSWPIIPLRSFESLRLTFVTIPGKLALLATTYDWICLAYAGEPKRTVQKLLHTMVVVVVWLSCLTLRDLMEFSPSSSSCIHEISQARILEWIVTSFSRGSSRPRDRNCISCVAGIFFYCWVTRETLHSRTVVKQKKVSAFQKESLNILLMGKKKKDGPYSSFLIRAVSFSPFPFYLKYIFFHMFFLWALQVSS